MSQVVEARWRLASLPDMDEHDRLSVILSAMEDAPHVYFDQVSQIHMPRWSRGSVALLGDAAGGKKHQTDDRNKKRTHFTSASNATCRPSLDICA